MICIEILSSQRELEIEVLEKRYAPHTCPFCGHKGRVTRISTGIWMCKSVE